MSRLTFIFFLALAGCKHEMPKEAPPPAVHTASVRTRTLPLYKEYIAHIDAYVTVDIRAQVEGKILQIHFVPGEPLKSGDLLYTLDSAPYLARKEAALGKYAQSKAELTLAEQKISRYKSLKNEGYVSELDYAKIVAQRDSLKGILTQIEADIALADIDLNRCYITAPTDGFAGINCMSVGNTVTRGNETLCRINRMHPVYASISVPASDLPLLQKAKRDGVLETFIYRHDNDCCPLKGELPLVDNNINQKSGTFYLSATLENDEHTFWPGQFVRVRTNYAIARNAKLVPMSAIVLGSKGKYIYTIDDDQLVHKSKVTLGQEMGDYILVTSGVSSGQHVVTEGQINVQPGKKARVIQHVGEYE